MNGVNRIIILDLVLPSKLYTLYEQEDKLTNRESDDLVIVWSFRLLHRFHERPSVWVCLKHTRIRTKTHKHGVHKVYTFGCLHAHTLLMNSYFR